MTNEPTKRPVVYLDGKAAKFAGVDILPSPRLWCVRDEGDTVGLVMCTDSSGRPSGTIYLQCTRDEAVAWFRAALEFLEATQ